MKKERGRQTFHERNVHAMDRGRGHPRARWSRKSRLVISRLILTCCASLVVSCTPHIKFDFTSLDDEASYEDWLPGDGNRVNVTATLKNSVDSTIPAEITLYLDEGETSRLAGKYTNDRWGYDGNPDFTVISDKGTAGITIRSHDYGGSALVRAETFYKGEQVTGALRIPEDSDGDGLPDSFERRNAAENGLDCRLADTDGDGTGDAWEDEDESVNNTIKGDGLTAFQEYRGVMWNGKHERLDPSRKDLFVCGVDFYELPGEPQSPDLLPLVVGDAFANAHINVHTTQTSCKGNGWDRFEDTFEDKGLDVLIIRNYPGRCSYGYDGHISWVEDGTWELPLLGDSYSGTMDEYGQPTRIYGKCIENYMKNDRPYEDENGNGLLDPEERDENVASSWGNIPKIEDLNPFNIDDDAFAELPQQHGDPALLEGSGRAPCEYDFTAVVRHVITHELGHAVGMGKGDVSALNNGWHCCDPTCVMYQWNIDWNRSGKFCPYHQGLIRVHNK